MRFRQRGLPGARPRRVRQSLPPDHRAAGSTRISRSPMRWSGARKLFILTPDAALLRRLAGAIEGGRLFHEIRYFADPAQPRFEGAPPVATNNVHFVSPGGPFDLAQGWRSANGVLDRAIVQVKCPGSYLPSILCPAYAYLSVSDPIFWLPGLDRRILRSGVLVESLTAVLTPPKKVRSAKSQCFHSSHSSAAPNFC